MTQVPDAPQLSIASLYVGDLKTDVSEQLLWNVFSPHGQVISVKICRDSQSQVSLGYGYVNFRTVHEAEKAMENINFTPIDGKPCRVMWSMRDSNRRKLGIGNLFIKNIDPMLDSKSLYHAFKVFGPVLSCKIAVDEYGCSKGYGFIQFYNEKDADIAISRVNGINFSKKKLFVTKFVPKASRTDAKPVDPNIFTNVFVKNFGPDFLLENLKKLFSKFGEITSVVIQKDENEKSLGFGFINYKDFHCASKAVVEMNDFELPSGEKLFVCRAMKKHERQAFLKKQREQRKLENYKQSQNLNLYVKNFDDSITDEKLNELFNSFGTIKSAQVMKDENGKSRGFGFVCFSTPEEAQAAISAMHQKEIDGKSLYVSIAQNKEERKKLLEHQTYNNSFRAPMFPPASAMPFVYTHPASLSYHPANFARFSQPMQNRTQNRSNQQQPNSSGQHYNNRQGYTYLQNQNYTQSGYKSRTNMSNVSRSQQNSGFSTRHQSVQTTITNVISEPVQRPRRDDNKNVQTIESQDFKSRIYHICQSVFSKNGYDNGLLSRIAGIVVEHYSKNKTNQALDDEQLVMTIVNAYDSFLAHSSVVKV